MRTRRAFVALPLFGIVLACSTMRAAEPFSYVPGGSFSAAKGRIVLAQEDAKSDVFALSVAGKTVVRFSGLHFYPGDRESELVKIDNLAGQNKVVAKEKLPGGHTVDYARSFAEVNGGVLVDVAIERLNPSVTAVRHFIHLDFDRFKGRKVSWGGKTVALPTEKLTEDALTSSSGGDDQRLEVVRLALEPGLELGIKFLMPVGETKLRGCPPKKDSFCLEQDVKGLRLLFFVCLLKSGEEFPSPVEAVAEVTPDRGNLLKEGASFETGPDGIHVQRALFQRGRLVRNRFIPTYDSTTAAHGKFSLKLYARGVEKNGKHIRCSRELVIFNRVELKPDRQYTLSAWMKTDVPKTRAAFIWPGKTRAHTVTDEWKRYSILHKTPAIFPESAYYAVGVAVVSMSPRDAAIWVDGMQLEEGDKMTDFQPSTDFEVGAEVTAKYKLFRRGEPAVVTLRFRNNTAKPVAGNVSYVIRDYWEQAAAEGAMAINVPPQGNYACTIDAGALPCGYYRGYVTAPGGEVEEVIFGVFAPMPLEKLPTDWPMGFYFRAEKNPIMRQLGFGWAVTQYPFNFYEVNREEGKFDFAEADRLVECAEANGLRVAGGLGYQRFVTRYNALPEWAREKTIAAKHGRPFHWPKEDALRNYIRAVTRRYRGKVNHWEFFSEFNTHLDPEQILPLMKIAYEAAKEGNPDCVVVASGTTSDMGFKPMPWVRKYLALGGWKYIDALSFHMYGNEPPEATKTVGVDAIIEEAKRELKKHGQSMPLWHSEKGISGYSGYSQRKLNVPKECWGSVSHFVEDFKAKSEYVIRDILFISALGNGPYFPHGAVPNDIRTQSYSKPSVYPLVEYDQSPRPELMAINGLARMLKGRSHGRGQLNWGGINRCLLHSGDEGALASIWNWKGRSKIAVPVKDHEFRLCDYFGEPIKTEPDKNGEIVIDLAPAPKYLVFPGLDAEAARSIMQSIRQLEGKVMEVAAGLGFRDGRPVAEFLIKNVGAAMLAGGIKITAVPEGWKAEDAAVGFEKIRPGEIGTAEVPFAQYALLPRGGRVSALLDKEVIHIPILPFIDKALLKEVLAPSGSMASYAVGPGSIKLDGDLSEWDEKGTTGVGSLTRVFGDKFVWKGVSDLSATVRARWDGDNLYFAARIYDDKFVQPNTAYAAYDADSIELYLNLDLSDDELAEKSGKTNYKNKDDFQCWFAPFAKGSPDAPTVSWGKTRVRAKTTVASKRMEDGYTFEIAIPCATFRDFAGQKGKTIGFTYMVNDADVKLNKCHLIWAGGFGNHKYPSQWGRMTFR